MSCSHCQHDDHLPNPCATCATSQGTCWQRPTITGGDGDTTAHSKIELATGTETRPCMMCKSWENVGVDRVAQHFLANGLTARPDGQFVTPIAKDFPGRKSLVLDPHNFGFCRRTLMPTDLQATCIEWSPTKHLADLQRRLR